VAAAVSKVIFENVVLFDDVGKYKFVKFIFSDIIK